MAGIDPKRSLAKYKDAGQSTTGCELRLYQIALLSLFFGAPNVQADMTSPFQVPFDFELESDLFGDVRGRFGDAEEFDIPDSHHEVGICYLSSDSGEIVIFVSGHEFGGADRKLLGVTIQAKNSHNFPCAPSMLESSDLRIGELRLGLTPDEFAALSAGKPRTSDDGSIYLDLEYRRALNEDEQRVFEERGFGDATPEGIDVGLGIWSKFSGGHSVEVGVWQISTF